MRKRGREGLERKDEKEGEREGGKRKRADTSENEQRGDEKGNKLHHRASYIESSNDPTTDS